MDETKNEQIKREAFAIKSASKHVHYKLMAHTQTLIKMPSQHEKYSSTLPAMII